MKLSGNVLLASNLVFVIILGVIGCRSSDPKSDQSETFVAEDLDYATQIVLKSIDRHGGVDTWQSASEISYKKTTILFDSLGAEESRTVQYHKYKLKPDLSGTIEWKNGESTYKIVYSDGIASKYVDEVAELDSESMADAMGTMMSSYFVLFQPFKLMDPGTRLEYVGEDTLEDGTSVNVIRPVYGEPKDGDDVWWFYFDAASNQLLANMVNHDGHFSYIRNLAFDSSTPLVLNQHRKSYFVDSLRNVRYLRAEYFYEDFMLDSENEDP